MVASQQVSAIAITPSSGVLNTTRWVGNQPGQSQINTAIAPFIGSATELYKQDFGSPTLPNEEGGLAGSYSTSFAADSVAGDGKPADATITYDGGSYVGSMAYLLVKDGNHTPAWYLFNLTALGWNGTDVISATGFWLGGGAISHVTLYGTSTPAPVPDGGTTAALLGLGMMGIGFMARRKA